MNQPTNPQRQQQPSGNPQAYRLQNYPQQRAYPTQEPQFYIPPQKKHNFIAIGLILIVIIGAVGLYFAIPRKIY